MAGMGGVYRLTGQDKKSYNQSVLASHTPPDFIC